MRAMLERDPASVASKELTEQLAMSEWQSNGGVLSLGAVGTLGALDDTQRQARIDYCPELKMMFPSLHSPTCFGAGLEVFIIKKYPSHYHS